MRRRDYFLPGPAADTGFHIQIAAAEAWEAAVTLAGEL